MKEESYWESKDGEIRIWIEQNHSICLKVITKEGDPVEITGDEALKLAKILEDFGNKVNL